MRVLTTGRSKLMYFTKSLKEILETIPLVYYLFQITQHIYLIY